MTFALPLFLLGLIGLALPWALHRFNRENPPELPFPSTQFLEATQVPVSRRKKFRHWVLLLLRTLLLLALCFLFAEPHCALNEARVSDERMTFVVVDRSASMRAGTRWDDAVAEAISALESAVENSSKVQLFDFAADLTARSEPTADVSHAINVLRALAPSFERAAYGVTMQQLDTLASRQTVPVEVVMITDIQSSNLPLQRRLLRTQHIDQLNLKTIHGDDQNMAVRASASSKDGVNVRVNAQVLLSQTTAAELNRAAELRVRAGEKLLATESLRLSANTIESLTLNDLILPSAETHTLSVDVVAAESDDLQEDSSVDVPIRRTAPIPVGLLRLNNDQAEAAMLYLRTALATDDLAQVINAVGANPSLSNRAKHWIVFYPHKAGSSVQLSDELTEFVTEGGNVLLVLQEESTQTTGLDDDVSSTDVATFLGSVDVAHPLALGELDWQDASVYSPVSITLGPQDKVLMKTGLGDPLLAERTFVEQADAPSSAFGRVLILADPLDGRASDLPLQSAFVDWVAQTVKWFDASVSIPGELDAGDSVMLPARTQVLAPDGEALRSLADTAQANRHTFSQPGVHTVITNVSEQRVAVSMPWEESDLTVIPDDLVALWASGVMLNDEASDADTATDDTPQSATNEDALPEDNNVLTRMFSQRETNGQPLWPWLLALLALTFLAETLLGNRRLSVRREG